MRLTFWLFGIVLLEPLLCAALQNPQKGRPDEKQPPAGEERTNPIKPTQETLAAAKKLFGYDCAMCHGAAGDGKGDLAASMGLKMNDWRDSSKVTAMSDAGMFDLIVKGKGKMIGEGDRYPAETVWELVNYVRTFANEETAATPESSH